MSIMASDKYPSYREILRVSNSEVRVSNIDEVIGLETRCINVRRRRQGREELEFDSHSRSKRDCCGLALSGGGIRSAAFGLGALQALNQDGVIDRVDYLSTVSGGGYIGTSLSCGLSAGDGKFPFATDDSDKSDNAAVAHLRNYSNYLIPAGFQDALACLSVVLRGLGANLAIVLGILLVLAGITLLMNPNQESLARPDLLGWADFPGHPPPLNDTEKQALLENATAIAKLEAQLKPLLELDPKNATLAELERKAALQAQLKTETAAVAHLRARAEPADFFFAKLLLVATIIFHIGWAIWRSIRGDRQSEFVGPGAVASKLLIGALILAACLELQPFALRGLFQLYVQQGSDSWLGWIAQIGALVTPYLAPLAAAAAFASNTLGNIIKTKQGESGVQALMSRVTSKLILALAALALPLMLWVAYLSITISGDIGFSYRPGWMQWLVGSLCDGPDIGSLHGTDTASACKKPRLLAWMFLLAGFALTLVTWLTLTPNGNSLHRLYRDRLSKAFLFRVRDTDETNVKAMTGEAGAAPRPRNEEPDWLDKQRLTDLRPGHGPLHLINTALNIQGSKYVNKRGRNADFFQFSPVYCGSASTGYVRTDALEDRCKEIDLATAMAISGAAASSNMGSNTISGFAPTLALLNIRLGYWLRNPKFLFDRSWSRRLLDWLKPYLWQESLGMLHENRAQIYLTDGGHIENLGLYELLRRRCATIIVLDAEADPQFSFRSLVEAERYARIDLGVRLDLPWRDIQASSLAVNDDIAKDQRRQTKDLVKRTHVARGVIEYGPNDLGEIIYIKASLTGDENDYILDYKARNPAFPHETTGDQMFSEEQFECYRALGFHAAHKVFDPKDGIVGTRW